MTFISMSSLIDRLVRDFLNKYEKSSLIDRLFRDFLNKYEKNQNTTFKVALEAKWHF